jgi:hypothetical protein
LPSSSTSTTSSTSQPYLRDPNIARIAGSRRLGIVGADKLPENQEKPMLVRRSLAVVAAVGAVALGGDAAWADTAPPTAAPDHANSAICAKRVPAVLARIDKLTARVNGDASVKGSTAWLRAKANEARAAGYTALADLLAARADSRPGRLDELTKLRADVQHVKETDCAG